MKPQLEAQLQTAQDGYEQLESGKLTAGMNSPRPTRPDHHRAKASWTPAKAEFEKARDQALERPIFPVSSPKR